MHPFFVYVLLGTRHSQTSVTVQRGISPIDHLEKLARQAQQLVSGKGKHNWKSNNCWFCKKKNLWFGPNNNPVLPETQKCVLLTTGHALPHWSTDKMKSLMNKYQGSINKAMESAYLSCPTIQSTAQESPCTLPLDIPNSLMSHWRFARHTSFPVSWI